MWLHPIEAEVENTLLEMTKPKMNKSILPGQYLFWFSGRCRRIRFLFVRNPQRSTLSTRPSALPIAITGFVTCCGCNRPLTLLTTSGCRYIRYPLGLGLSHVPHQSFLISSYSHITIYIYTVFLYIYIYMKKESKTFTICKHLPASGGGVASCLVSSRSPCSESSCVEAWALYKLMFASCSPYQIMLMDFFDPMLSMLYT